MHKLCVCMLMLLCGRTLEVANCSQFTHNGFQALTKVRSCALVETVHFLIAFYFFLQQIHCIVFTEKFFWILLCLNTEHQSECSFFSSAG